MTLAQRAEYLRGNRNEQETKQDNGEGEKTEKNQNKRIFNASSKTVATPGSLSEKVSPIKTSWFDRLILHFVTALQNIAFLFSALADFGLACFFYYSLGFDDLSKIVLMVFGGVQTGGKLWGWSTRKIPLALLCAVLSVLATLTVFMAVIDMQSQTTKIEKTKIVLSIEADIDSKMADQKILQDRLASMPSDYTTAVNKLIKSIADNDDRLNDLRKQLATESAKKADPLKLDAWKIFRQLVEFNYRDAAHIYAFIIILLIAVLLELLIYFTIPRSIDSKINSRADQ